MTSRFVDSYFYLALINPRDGAHGRAVSLAKELRGQFVTTQWVLTEVADALSQPPGREKFRDLLEGIASDPRTEIVEASAETFQRGVELYAKRPDKSWSLTDCISFVVMSDRGLTEALTGDHHFEQAGFKALLRDP